MTYYAQEPHEDEIDADFIPEEDDELEEEDEVFEDEDEEEEEKFM